MRDHPIIFCDSIVGMGGETMQQKTFMVNKGNNTIMLETSSLAAGIYAVVVKGETLNERIKFIKQ
jgi:hypothetical protein